MKGGDAEGWEADVQLGCRAAGAPLSRSTVHVAEQEDSE